MMNRKTLSSLLLAAVALTGAGAANAALLQGQTLQYQWLINGNTCGGSQTAVVGGGLEFPSNANDSCNVSGAVRDWFDLNISDTEILVSFNEDADFSTYTFNGFRLRDVNGTIAAFTGLTLLDERGPFTASRLTFDANNIFFNFSNLEFDGSGSYRDFIRVGVQGASVPEPGTLALLGLGLAGLGLARRRRQG